MDKPSKNTTNSESAAAPGSQATGVVAQNFTVSASETLRSTSLNSEIPALHTGSLAVKGAVNSGTTSHALPNSSSNQVPTSIPNSLNSSNEITRLNVVPSTTSAPAIIPGSSTSTNLAPTPLANQTLNYPTNVTTGQKLTPVITNQRNYSTLDTNKTQIKKYKESNLSSTNEKALSGPAKKKRATNQIMNKEKFDKETNSEPSNAATIGSLQTANKPSLNVSSNNRIPISTNKQPLNPVFNSTSSQVINTPTSTGKNTVSMSKKALFTPDWELYRRRFQEKDLSVGLTAAQELRERVEIVHSTEYPSILKHLMEPFTTVLTRRAQPSSNPESVEYNIRKIVLEILSRLPYNEVLKPHSRLLLYTSMDVLKRDYEENALVASRIIFDLHKNKNYRPMLMESVQPFLDFVQNAYKELSNSVKANFILQQQNAPLNTSSAAQITRFDTPSLGPHSKPMMTTVSSTNPTRTNTSDSSSSQSQKNKINSSDTNTNHHQNKQKLYNLPPLKSISSFRVLNECPLTVMFLFRFYPVFIKSNIPKLIPVMMDSLSLSPPPPIPPPPLTSPLSLSSQQKIKSQEDLQYEQNNTRLYFIRSRELIACQVKTLSFLTYLLRDFAEQLKPHDERIANSVVKLMKSCPPDSTTTRKELLVATRHILAIEHFRKGFYNHVDTMLDERVLFGTHRHTEQSMLRPLGYSTLADLIHNARSKLSITQMPRIILIFSRVIHDSSFPVTIQTTSVRLLLNLLDYVVKNDETNAQGRRDLLFRIFDTLVNKFDSLQNYIPSVMNVTKIKLHKEVDFERGCLGHVPLEERVQCDYNSKSTRKTMEEKNNILEENSEKFEIAYRRPHALGGRSDVKDSIQDIQSLMKSIISGLKTAIWCLGSSRSQVKSEIMLEHNVATTQKLSHAELDLVFKYMKWGLACMYVFKLDHDANIICSSSSKTLSSNSVSSKIPCSDGDKRSGELKKDVAVEFYERFAASFTVLDGFSLRRAIGPQMPDMFEYILKDEVMITIPQHLVNNRDVSTDFCDILVQFFLEKMSYLAVPLHNSNTPPSALRNCTTYSFSHHVHLKFLKSDNLHEKKAAVLICLLKIVLQSFTKYPNNEFILRTHLQKIIATCLRGATESSSVWPGYFYAVLRVIFRAISVGKFEKSYKEILPLLPTMFNGLWRIHCSTNDAFIKTTIVELCLTTPARLSSLLPHIPLLLRIIITALKSQHGDLINLGLRTLQFWVENLNPKFLHPIISQDNYISTELMVALCSHLRPAPYPYGLISIRLLGKLGGNNRKFFREPMDFYASNKDGDSISKLNLQCSWFELKTRKSCTGNDFGDPITENVKKDTMCNENYDKLTLPLDKAISTALETLKRVADAPHLKASAKPPISDSETLHENDYSLLSIGKVNQAQQKKIYCSSVCPITCEEVLSSKVEKVDFTAYSILVMENTKKNQVNAAFTLLRGILSGMIESDEINDIVLPISTNSRSQEGSGGSQKQSESKFDENKENSIDSMLSSEKEYGIKKELLCGIMFSTLHNELYDDAMKLLKGFASQMILVCATHHEYICRTDTSGNTSKSNTSRTSSFDKTIVSDTGRLLPIGPYAKFRFFGILKHKANPFVINEAIVDFSATNSKCSLKAIEIILHLVRTSQKCCSKNNNDEKKEVLNMNQGCIYFFENLLGTLCQSCFSLEWNSRFGVYKIIYCLCAALGPGWTRLYEVEIMHTILHCLNSSLKEVSCASIETLLLMFRILTLCHGSPKYWNQGTQVLYDLLSTSPDENVSKNICDVYDTPVVVSSSILSLDQFNINIRCDTKTCLDPPAKVIQLLISELTSPIHAVRFGVRHCLRQICATISEHRQFSMENMLGESSSLIKRLLMSRSVRTLPLPEQVAVVDGLAFIVQEAPSLILLTDQRLLETMSDLLKMAAVADGVIQAKNQDPFSKGIYIDKNGYAVAITDDVEISNKMTTSTVTHASSIFLRKDHILNENVTGGIGKICVPAELPLGVQLRLSSLLLFRAVIRRHADAFFDAASTTPIGNIRPHVVALLFRSLISQSPAAVACAHSALKDVPFYNGSAGTSDSNPNRDRMLPKDLVQTCIRPVLLDLRDYKKLTIPLLRGLTRLLSLLSDWFNKALGDKLLDHLEKWTEPEKIMSLRIFREGEEPQVAAAIIDIFRMLPHHHNFVEKVIEKTIRLESVLPRFRLVSISTRSPYRTPLALYLNRHCNDTISYFLHEDRLSNPIFSELFNDILKYECSSNLRNYLSTKDVSLRLMNLCFEKPLAIIRAEKTNKIKMERSSFLNLHGINEAAQFAHRQKQSNEKKTNNIHFDENLPSPMTSKALELQFQGLQLIDTLVAFDKNYLRGSNHEDVVTRYRWLWRAKGRYLRLLHEDCLPAKYQAESKLIASLLMKNLEVNVEVNPNVIDILFELLRIFLQPTAVDFSFVDHFIEHMVTNVLNNEQRHKVLMRFFDVLASEGTEETKVLSIELIVLPILNVRQKTNKGHHKSYWEPTKGSWITEASDSIKLFLDENESLGNSKENEPSTDNAVLDVQFVNRFMKDALLKGASGRGFGDKLQIELLKISTLLIENFRDCMVEYRKDLIKFAWNHLKTEDSGSKYWAYVNVSRFISVYDTPPKIILQVYLALLRATQPESKYLVRAALDILVPCLPRRLPKDDLRDGMRWTKRIVCEENHSIPQLSHIWNTIARHPKVFYFFHEEFIPLMVNSLHCLGLTPICSLENRTLSLNLVDIIISWEEYARNSHEKKETGLDKKRIASNILPSPKKRKVELESSSEKEKKEIALVQINEPTLNHSMIDIIANFLVRICIVTSKLPEENGHTKLGRLSTSLFSRLVRNWGNATEIHAVYFDEIFLLCKNETALQFSSKKEHDNIFVDKGKVENRPNGVKNDWSSDKLNSKTNDSLNNTTEVSKTREGSLMISTIIACLDIFNTLLEFAPKNQFFTCNELKLQDFITSCFLRSIKSNGTIVRQRLKRFIFLLVSKQGINNEQKHLFQAVKSSIEYVVSNSGQVESESSKMKSMNEKGNDATKSQNQNMESIEETNLEDDFEIRRVGGRCSSYFTIQLIEDISRIDKKFIENFTGIILNLALQITSKITKMKTSGSQLRRSGRPEVLATPTINIMEEACDHGIRFPASNLSRNSVKDKNPGIKEVQEPGSAIRSLIVCLRLLSMSSVPYTFTQQRKRFFQMMSTILESCDSVPLLISAVGILGTWLLNGGGPMTIHERKSFLWKITDIRCLPEVPSQALVDIVAQMLISLYASDSIIFKSREQSNGGTQIFPSTSTVNGKSHDTEKCLQRSLIATLLSANIDLRSRLIDAFDAVSHSNSNPVEAEPENEERKSIDTLIDAAGFPWRGPIDIFWKLVRSDWEGIGDRFWIVAFLELLLASDKLGGDICLFDGNNLNSKGYNGTLSGKPIFMFANPRKANGKGNNSEHESNEQVIALDDFECYLSFRRSTKRANGLNEVLRAMTILSHANLNLCENLFEVALTNIWNGLCNDDTRLAFGTAIESLLAKPYHSQFLHESTLLTKFSKYSMHPRRSNVNVVKVWLRTLSKLSPLPYLDADLLMSLSNTYNTWHEAIEILQQQYASIGTSDEYSFLKENIFHALRKCYDCIGEKDISLSLMIRPGEIPGTKRAISLELYGHIEEALSSFRNLVDEVDNTSSWTLPPSETELSFWEEQWIELNRELCQWSVLSNYAKNTGSPRMMVESAWKSRDWSNLRKLIASPSVIADLECGDPLIKITEIILAISDGKLNDVEHLHAQSAQLCLHQWQLLPRISTACLSHNSLLQTFHRLVELRESGQVMIEIRKHSNSQNNVEVQEHRNNRKLPDFKNLLSTWKDRLPNEHESLRTWEDLFLWRNHVFSAIQTSFQWSEPGTLATLHDRPWTSIRMAKTARKHGMKEVAFTSLNMLTDCAMDVSDAFLKLREQILGYMNPDSQLERRGGLNLVNTTNLSYFDSAQKSELFRLKASFLSSLGQRGKANQAYCHAVRVCPGYWKAWVEWGKLCSSLADSAEQPNGSNDKSASSEKKVAQYLAQAMGCFFEAIQCNANQKTNMHIPRCLWMLQKQITPGVLCQTLQDRGTSLPEWVWLPWLPQLLTSLSRVESKAIKSILHAICLRYPQSLYYSLRAFYLERRDVERVQKVKTNDQSRQNNSTTAVNHAEVLMSDLRKAHPTLWTNLEAILEELILRFRPSFEEELLVPIITLLGRALKQQSLQDGCDSFITSFNKTIIKVSSKLFRSPSASPVRGLHMIDIRLRKATDFCERYKADFETDFCIGNGTGVSPLNLPRIIEKLKKWKRILQQRVSASVASHPLLHISSQLSRISYQVPDIWQGSCDTLVRQSSISERSNVSDSSSALSSSILEAYAAAEAVASKVAALAAAEGGGSHFGGGSEAIEIPGQYPPNSMNCVGSKPAVELHSKIVRFDSNVEIIWKSPGQQLMRRIGLVGSDGKTSHFLLHFSIPYMARTDERSAQLHYLISSLLSMDHMALRRNLNVQPTAIIPIASRIRMTGDECSHISLDKVFRLNRMERCLETDAPKIYFQQEVTKRIALHKAINNQANSQNQIWDSSVDNKVKLEVFNEICNNMVESNILLLHVMQVLTDPEALFAFRKAFCGQLATSCLLQYAFSILDRSPLNFVFNKRNARVLTPDFKFAYNNQGLLETNLIPFRMTRNIQTLVGTTGAMSDGVLIPGICSVASGLWEYKDEIDSVLRLLLRDDMISWYTSKSMARGDTETQELERQFADRIIKNVSLVRGRIEECVPKFVPKTRETEKIESMIDTKVRCLMEMASAPEKLCLVPANFQGWL